MTTPTLTHPGVVDWSGENPGMYLKDGKPRLLFGTQGADGQPQTLAAILTRLIDYDMDLAKQEAEAATTNHVSGAKARKGSA